MKFSFFVFVCTTVFLLATFYQSSAEYDCAKVPKVDIHSCCKFPKMVDPKLIGEVKESMGKFDPEKMRGVMYVCKFKQTIFEKLNLVKDGDFHEAEAVAYVENHLKDDAEWQDVLKKAVPECHKGVDPHMGGLQESTNFTKQECNMKFHILTHCMDIFGFTHCPTKALTDDATCKDAQNFVHDCHENIGAMIEFSTNIIQAKKEKKAGGA